jgi:PIN domain
LGKLYQLTSTQDVWFLKRLLEAHRDGEVFICTSVLTIAECRHAGDDDVTNEVKSLFNRLLTSGQYVRLVQLTPFIAQDARDLRWIHGISGLRGPDSIHVASALEMRCEEFLSCNAKLERIGALGTPLARMGLYVKRAKESACLPDKYRQMYPPGEGRLAGASGGLI